MKLSLFPAFLEHRGLFGDEDRFSIVHYALLITPDDGVTGSRDFSLRHKSVFRSQLSHSHHHKLESKYQMPPPPPIKVTIVIIYVLLNAIYDFDYDMRNSRKILPMRRWLDCRPF